MEKNINDKELEQILTEKIKEDPVYYLHFLKSIIDRETPNVSIDDEAVFEALRPVFNNRKHVPHDELTGSNIDESDFDLMPTSASVDLLFFPWIRDKLKKWQALYFDERLKDYEKEKGKNNIEKVFTSLIYRGSGRLPGISRAVEQNIMADFLNVNTTCKKISKTNRWNNSKSREFLICSSFPDVGADIVKENVITSVNQLRNLVLSKRHGCSVRNVEDFVRREYGIFKYFKRGSNVATVEDDPQKTIITFKDGKQNIIDK